MKKLSISLLFGALPQFAFGSANDYQTPTLSDPSDVQEFRRALARVDIKKEKQKGRTALLNDDILMQLPPFQDQIAELGGETKRVDTSGYSGATVVHNPSILDYNGRTYMTFRIQGDGGVPFKQSWKEHPEWYARTEIAEVDADFNIITSTPIQRDDEGKTHEDARLFVYDGKLHVSFVSDVSYKHGQYNTCMHIGEFDRDLKIKSKIRPNIGTNASMDCTEKNWCFFEQDNRKFVIDFMNPMKVWEYPTADLTTPHLLVHKQRAISDWNLSHIRASTTPILLPDLNQYFTIFHSFVENHPYDDSRSSKDQIGSKRVYFLGAMLFDRNFNITFSTKDPLIFSTPHIERSLGAYTVLPYGCIRRDQDIIMSLGINDSQAWIAKLPLQAILSKMTYIDDRQISFASAHTSLKKLPSNTLFAKQIEIPQQSSQKQYTVKGLMQMPVVSGTSRFTLPHNMYLEGVSGEKVTSFTLSNSSEFPAIMPVEVTLSLLSSTVRNETIQLPFTLHILNIKGQTGIKYNPKNGKIILS